jgi:hypothetical protein
MSLACSVSKKSLGCHFFPRVSQRVLKTRIVGWRLQTGRREIAMNDSYREVIKSIGNLLRVWVACITI